MRLMKNDEGSTSNMAKTIIIFLVVVQVTALAIVVCLFKANGRRWTEDDNEQIEYIHDWKVGKSQRREDHSDNRSEHS